MADDETYPTPPQAAEQYSPYYGGGIAKTSALSLGDLRHPPVRRLVEQQITELKAQLKEREDFLLDLDKEPNFEKLLDRMRRLSI